MVGERENRVIVIIEETVMSASVPASRPARSRPRRRSARGRSARLARQLGCLHRHHRHRGQQLDRRQRRAPGTTATAARPSTSPVPRRSPSPASSRAERLALHRRPQHRDQPGRRQRALLRHQHLRRSPARAEPRRRLPDGRGRGDCSRRTPTAPSFASSGSVSSSAFNAAPTTYAAAGATGQWALTGVANENRVYRITWSFPSTASDNTYQGTTASAVFNWTVQSS